MINIGIDLAAPLNAVTARDLYAAGYRFVGRYFATPGCGSKILKAEEAKLLGNAGLRVLSVFEVNGDDYAGGAERGARYGAAALDCARAVGMPESGIIYFAIDSVPSDMDKVEEYLRACAAACAPYRIGVYGSYYVVEAMAARGVCDAYWQCLAWSDRKISRHMDVYQHNFNLKDCGVTVDQNVCVDMDKAGLWLPGITEESGMPPAEEAKPAHTANDAPGWAKEATEYCISKGIFRGDGQGNYDWNAPITRAQMAQVIYNTLLATGRLDELWDVK